MTRHYLKIYPAIFFLTTSTLFAQSQENLKLPEPKRFIDKVEVFVGPNLSFNHGNKFIENYKDENVRNTRLLKPGYSFGIGGYHPLANRLDLNVRLQFEQKGTKNELNTPVNPVNDDAREITKDNYIYNYLTINASPTYFFGRKNRWMISLGGYYSKIKNLRGSSESYNTRDFQVNKGSFVGRYFYHLREDGATDGFSWMPHLTSIEDYDWGLITSIGYRIPFNQKHSMFIQLQDNFGLKNINKNNPYSLKENNHSFSLIISYTYHLPPKSLRL